MAAFIRVLALLVVIFPLPLLAQDFPTRPITLLVPVAPGAGVDALVRGYAETVSKNLGQRILIENNAGAGGIVAATRVKESPPDGYNLLNTNQAIHSVLSSLRSLPYDPLKDFEPITNLFAFSTYLVVPSSLPVKTPTDLVALARKTPGGLSFASQGIGSGTHLLGAMWAHTYDMPYRHVPYRGQSQMMPDLLAGQIDYTFSGYVALREHVEAGRLRILAVAGPRRWAGLPDVPTMEEAGFPGIQVESWFGLAAAAGTPKSVVQKLNAAFVKASSDPELIKLAAQNGVMLRTSTPEEFAALWASDTERWGKIIRDLGIKLE